MEKARLSSQGELIIPINLRSRYHWNAEQEVCLIDTGDGILVKPFPPFKPTQLDEVAGLLKYSGKPKSIREMDEAIQKGAREQKK